MGMSKKKKAWIYSPHSESSDTDRSNLHNNKLEKMQNTLTETFNQSHCYQRANCWRFTTHMYGQPHNRSSIKRILDKFLVYSSIVTFYHNLRIYFFFRMGTFPLFYTKDPKKFSFLKSH